MHNNPKLDALHRQSTVERLFGKEAAASRQPDAATGEKHGEESPLERKSYRILRGRIEHLPMLRLMNRQGESRLFPWSHIAGVNMNHPGELVLLFDGPESSCAITITGRGLDVELLDGMQSERVEWIAELEELAAAAVTKADPDEPVVTGIFIKEGTVSRAWSRGPGPSR